MYSAHVHVRSLSLGLKSSQKTAYTFVFAGNDKADYWAKFSLAGSGQAGQEYREAKKARLCRIGEAAATMAGVLLKEHISRILRAKKKAKGSTPEVNISSRGMANDGCASNAGVPKHRFGAVKTALHDGIV